MIIPLIIYIFLGFFAGFCAGTLGIGGGVIVVPVLYWVFSYQNMSHPINAAIATSLSIMIFTGLASSISHSLKKAIKWEVVLFLSLGALGGGILGPYLSKTIPSYFLKYSFAGVQLFIGIYLLFHRKSKSGQGYEETSVKKRLLFLIIGIFIGTLSTLLGVGGGFLLVPILIALGFEPKISVGTSSAFTLSVAIIGSVSYFFVSKNSSSPFGIIDITATMAVAATSLCGAPLGAHFCHKVKASTLKKIFAIFLFLMAASFFL